MEKICALLLSLGCLSCLVVCGEEQVITLRQHVYDDSIYDTGSHNVSMFTIKKGSPLPLRVFTPSSNGTFPLIVFHHGAFLETRIYTGILTHISSHGYVIAAPQRRDSRVSTDATRDIADAARVIEWLVKNLATFLPAGVFADTGKLVNMGHSKGGKIAFALALHIGSNVSVPFATLIGLDPMDGTNLGQTQPPVLYARPIAFQYPTLIIGTGLGGACSPARFNHGAFFNGTRSVAFDLTPAMFGHMDFVDDLGISDRQRRYILACRRKRGREPMRRFTAGAVVAFLEAVLRGDTDAFANIVTNPASAPVLLRKPRVHFP